MATSPDFDCKYYVVEFDDGLQLIPKNWFCKGGSEVYWPNIKSQKTFEKAVEEMAEVEEDWKTHRVKNIYGKSNSFERGKQKLKDAEIYTDLSTDNEDHRKNQRKHAKKRKFSSSDESYGDDIANDILPLPKVPKNIESLDIISTQTPKSARKSQSSMNSPPSVSSKPNIISTVSTLKSQSSMNTPPSVSNKPKSNSKEEADNMRLVLRAITGLNYKLAAIGTSIDDISNRIKSIEEKFICMPEKVTTSNSNTSSNTELIDLEAVRKLFPIDSDESMGVIESKLEDNSFKLLVVKEFSKIGGKDLKNIVYNVLPHLLTDNYASKYSWYGAKGKKVFANLTLATVIQEVVRCRLKDASNTEIEVPVRKWLSKAKEKLERRRKREMTEHDQSLQTQENSQDDLTT